MAGPSGQQSGSMSFSMRTTVYGIKMKFPSIKNISCQDLDEWRKESKKLTCLDTRPVEEYSVSHLPEAVQIAPGETPDLDKLRISPDSIVVCYCSVGYRSSAVAQKILNAHGHLQIYNLEGGVFQWACEGRGLVDNHGDTTTTVHPYSTLWGKLLPQNLRHCVDHTHSTL